MARSYLSVNVTEEQQEFIKLLDEYEIDIFSITGIESKLSRQFPNLNKILENLVHKGFLSRIEKGKYCRANFRNEYAIGCFLAENSTVAYWSALNLHGLTEQFPNVVILQTDKLKKNKIVFGTSYKFVKVADYKMAGIQTQGQGNHQYRITNIEKTIVDCFDLPEYSGGYAELIRAFNQAQLSSDRMIEYCRKINNISIIKRIGLLSELLEKKDMKAFIKFARQKINQKYNLFDPMGTDKGEFVNKWRLRLNISRDKIRDICNIQY
jgi:predicted transcriptional regulator of viral defense system